MVYRPKSKTNVMNMYDQTVMRSFYLFPLVSVQQGGVYAWTHALHWLFLSFYHTTYTESSLYWNAVLFRLVLSEKIRLVSPSLGVFSQVITFLSAFHTEEPFLLTLVFILYASMLICCICNDVVLFFISLFVLSISYFHSTIIAPDNWKGDLLLLLNNVSVQIYETRLGAFRHQIHDEYRIGSILRYMSILMMIFQFARHIQMPVRSLKSVLTLCTASGLSFYGLRAAFLFFFQHQRWIHDTTLFSTQATDIMYSYLLCDMICGFLYYRSSFGILDGWMHHIGTLMLSHTLDKHSMYNVFDTLMITEVSTILLGIYRVFPSPTVSSWYKKLFPSMFVFFRIWLLSLMFYLSPPQPMFMYIYFTLFIIMNTYWLSVMIWGRRSQTSRHTQK